jgi:predicted amidohydrolase YtcJ
MAADNVLGFINGNIYVSFNPLRKATGLVTCGKYIVYSGESEKAERLVKTLNGLLIDLEGLTVMPGFIDVHMHLDMLAVSLNSIDLRGVESIESLKKRLREYYEKHLDSEWIVGRGWDQELFKERRWPNRFDLDEAVSEKPVLLERICGHAAVANTKALNIVCSNVDISKDPNFLRSEDGNLTGVIVEDAVKLFREYYQSSFSEMLKALDNSLKYTASLGVTTIGFMSCDAASLSLLQILKESRGLSVKVRVYLKDTLMHTLSSLGVRRGFGDDNLKIMGIKIFADGSLGARTAWLSEAYSDLPETCGMPTIKEEKLKEIVYECHKAGLQLAIHAIGDKAIDSVIDSYRLIGEGFSNYRHRIEHASVLRPEQIEKIAKLGLLVAVQPHFIISDWWAVKRVGEKRASWVYPFKSLIKSQVKIGFSTDCPVEPLNPWRTIYAAITRGRREGIELSKYTQDEALALPEALHYYTKGAAYFFFEEENTGILEPGKYADFIALDRDPFEVSLDELLSIKTLLTVISGRVVYQDKFFEDKLSCNF